MLILAETELHLPEGILLNQSFGSIFHGALISELDREWAERCMNSGFARTANIFGERGEALLASGSTDRRGFLPHTSANDAERLSLFGAKRI